jgi:hypothetical protein
MSEKPVSITGTAENAKAGAILSTGDGPVYVEGLQAWAADDLGKKLTLTGFLRRKQIYPEATPESQGMTGTPLVIQLTEPYRGSR